MITIANEDVTPTWLYIKQHNKTGLKYFGKTTKKNVLRYPGSGKYWRKHLRKHGNDVSTIWAHQFTDRDNLVNFALRFSSLNDIVNSDEWANLLEENGIDGKNPGPSERLRNLPKITCEYCGKSCSQINNTKYHGERCKLNPEGPRNREKRPEKIECEYCSKLIDPANYAQSHGNFCASNPNRIIDEEKLARKRKEAEAFNKPKLCKFCGNYFKPSPFKKYHGDKCLLNPNLSDDALKEIEQMKLKLNKIRKTCQHCGVCTNTGNYNRWHGEKCKMKV